MGYWLGCGASRLSAPGGDLSTGGRPFTTRAGRRRRIQRRPSSGSFQRAIPYEGHVRGAKVCEHDERDFELRAKWAVSWRQWDRQLTGRHACGSFIISHAGSINRAVYAGSPQQRAVIPGSASATVAGGATLGAGCAPAVQRSGEFKASARVLTVESWSWGPGAELSVSRAVRLRSRPLSVTRHYHSILAKACGTALLPATAALEQRPTSRKGARGPGHHHPERMRLHAISGYMSRLKEETPTREPVEAKTPATATEVTFSFNTVAQSVLVLDLQGVETAVPACLPAMPDERSDGPRPRRSSKPLCTPEISRGRCAGHAEDSLAAKPCGDTNSQPSNKMAGASRLRAIGIMRTEIMSSMSSPPVNQMYKQTRSGRISSAVHSSD